MAKSFWRKRKFRLNPNILFGSYRTYVIPTDTRDQLYKTTALGLNMNYDLIRYKAFSIVISGGGFVNYSRGIFVSSGYFHYLYFGGNFSIGMRIDPPRSKLAYVIKPINLAAGNNQFALIYPMFGLDIKFKAKK